MEKRTVPSQLAKTLEPSTIVISASQLPKQILDRCPEPPASDARSAITVETAESEAGKVASLQRDLQAGLDDLATGRVSDGKDVFVRLKARFPVVGRMG
jgi:hypothetical protein